MGVICQKLQSEEEIITRIFDSLLLKEIPVQQSYDEFQVCVVKDELDFFKYFNFVDKVIGSSSYKELQKLFFENLWKESENKLQKIGTLIIILSKGLDKEKLEFLVKHFENCYFTKNDNLKSKGVEIAIKIFLEDLIYINTSLCYLTFNGHVGNENMKNHPYIWNEKRKEKLLYSIYQNFESVKHKYQKRKTNELNNLNTRGSSDSIGLDYDSITLKEFFELIETQLDGDFIREWLQDDYMKEKCGDRICI
jgi:hypothetical protein